eukprot:14704986-Alexandrium_andersonii.AAC.1
MLGCSHDAPSPTIASRMLPTTLKVSTRACRCSLCQRLSLAASCPFRWVRFPAPQPQPPRVSTPGVTH